MFDTENTLGLFHMVALALLSHRSHTLLGTLLERESLCGGRIWPQSERR